MLVLLTTGANGQSAAPHRAFHFDMGTAASVVQTGWTQVTLQTVYSKESGYGWERPAANGIETKTGSVLGRLLITTWSHC